ncbi:SDR family oxidoreductase [Persicimonas caeni]|uniref:SDR family oxidoreductase n=1 Tax=Persicimonas caeni TaxID=2292766 RepID=A0A4Y6PVH5_PERCE|nr:SDR family oxidoreductase [Persicimonas caeni]QDG52240.1 SDR family oxidoreductase [Persicimonas caeni]QED33462.1 SDR family oxidoreductase [Persicimonas caeni]
MSVIGLFKGKGPSGYGWSTTAYEVVDDLDLSGRHVLITGCNSGIGFDTMKAVAERGATVFAAARTRQKAQDAGAKVDGETIPVVCELAEPESVQACVDEVREHGVELDAIICNAGIMALPQLELAHGYEKQFFTNHVGHFILVTGLLDTLSDTGRVVMVSSDAHRSSPKEGIQFDNLDGSKGYSAWRAYGQSKLANLLFAKELGRRFADDDTRRVANAVHPGVIATNLTRHMNPILRTVWNMAEPLFLKSSPQGAATQTWAAVHPDAATINGEYMEDCNVADPAGRAKKPELARRLWEETERIVDEVTA